jgi:hypothetical protein
MMVGLTLWPPKPRLLYNLSIVVEEAHGEVWSSAPRGVESRNL